MVRSTAQTRTTTLRAIGGFFAAAAIYHLAAVIAPALAGGSRVRHAVFVAVNAFVALGLFGRRPFFFWFFTALTLQQLHSHGGALVRAWSDAHRIDWQSVLVLVVVPVTWLLLYRERRDRTARSGPVA